MKKIFILSLFLVINFSFSQNKKKKVEYLNMTSFSFAKNTESYFSNFSKDSIRTFDGLAIDINTIHGAKFFGYVALSAGMSIDWNINRSFISTPIFVDIRAFSSNNKSNVLFIYLQTGRNIKFIDSSNGNGTSSRLGVGAIFDYNNKISYYADFYKKSKQIYLSNFKDFGYYNVSGYGLSLGIIF